MNKKKSRIRKSIRNFYIILAILIILICSVLINIELNKSNSSKKESILTYQNKLDVDYSVNIEKNEFIKDKTLPMGQIYVTDLIDSIDMDLNYLYSATEKAEVKYDYSIIGVLEAKYTKDGVKQKVWEEEYELKPVVENSINGKSIEIKEKVNIDLEKYNKKVYKFEQELGMGLEASLSIQLRVKMNSKIKGEGFKNEYVSNIKIELGEKTTQIFGDFNDNEKEEVKQSLIDLEDNSKTSAIIYIGIIILAAAWLWNILFNTKSTNVIKNEYKLELNKILKYCGDKIVKLSQQIELKGKEVIEVKDFGEIIKLSEELYKPVLYWDSPEKEEADFFIITNNVIYRYKLRFD